MPYITKADTKTAVQWKVRNQTLGPVNVELTKTYRSHIETQRVEKVSALGAGKVYDPSPDYILGTVHNVQVAVGVTSTDKQPAKSPAPSKPQTLRQDQLEEVAELKRHVAAVQAQKMNPAPTLAPAGPPATDAGQGAANFVRGTVHPVSPKGQGPFDDDEPGMLFGWSEELWGKTAYFSQVYQFKGKHRLSARAEAFGNFLKANGYEPPFNAELKFDTASDYDDMEYARKARARSMKERSVDYEVVETDHVWR